MTLCVIYARVSTKEQADEGYSIPAQLKAIREFCTREGYKIAEEFIEAESAGKAGRAQFGCMLEYFKEHPECRTVVAHKLDRLTRNFSDSLKLEDLGVKDRYVVSDFPEGPAGELARDVNLAVAKHYVNNLRGEVKKGMREKVAQGGWPHRAPIGYRNDRDTRQMLVDPETAPLVIWAFERYASGLTSMSKLCADLNERGFRTREGNRIHVSALDKMLKNPVYMGVIRWKGQLYPGNHEPLISPELFETVQEAFAPNRTKNNPKKRSYVLRDFLYCAECGAKITAGTHKGLIYYRCTHGKGECSQHSYVREELLLDEITDVLGRIAVGPDIIEALVEEARIAADTSQETVMHEAKHLTNSIQKNGQRADALLNNLLDGVISREIYQKKSQELENERITLELKRSQLSEPADDLSSQVEALARMGAGARIAFEAADFETRRETLANVLCNLTIEEGHIASYQWKDPFGALEMSPEGALCTPWWAIQDLNL